MKVLVVGAGPIAKEYLKVLLSMEVSFTVVGRNSEKLRLIKNEFACSVASGGVEEFLKTTTEAFDCALNVTGIDELFNVNKLLLKSGKIKKILTEKPGAFELTEFEELKNISENQKVPLFFAYNRRNHASTLKLKEILKFEKPTSIYFEFTEWFWRIDPNNYSQRVVEEWLLCNSTHVIDLAFFLGEGVEKINSLSLKSNESAKTNTQYVGSGKMKNGSLFSYSADWESAGRWRVEVSTNQGRYSLCPLEELHFQKKGELSVHKVEIDNSLDIKFKPGFYRQLEAILNNNVTNLKDIKAQVSDMEIFEKIKG